MQDPKVKKLVTQFNKDVAALNRTWAALQKNDVFARLELKGQMTYTEPKYVEVSKITQHVEYLTRSKAKDGIDV
jgi:hypothetical protein